MLQRHTQLDQGGREHVSLEVEMFGALVVPALKPGDLVLVEPNGRSSEDPSTDWWIGWITHSEETGAVTVGPRENTFQASDCETGQLRSVKGNEATRLVLSGINSTLKRLL